MSNCVLLMLCGGEVEGREGKGKIGQRRGRTSWGTGQEKPERQ